MKKSGDQLSINLHILNLLELGSTLGRGNGVGRRGCRCGRTDAFDGERRGAPRCPAGPPDVETRRDDPRDGERRGVSRRSRRTTRRRAYRCGFAKKSKLIFLFGKLEVYLPCDERSVAVERVGE